MATLYKDLEVLIKILNSLFISVPEFKLAVSQFNGKSSNQSNSYRYLEGENDIAAHTTVQQREIV